tara:strand:- start:3138 stop:3716 length:579 start_codon:yes stop_codon:yes gene_type:complete
MGWEYIVAAIIISATTAVTTYASMEAAQRQNEAIMEAMAKNQEMFAAKEEQLTERRDMLAEQTMEYSDIEALKQAKIRAIARGKIKVAQAEGGLSTGGSGVGVSLLNFADAESNFAQEVLALNTQTALEKIDADKEYGALQNLATYETQISNAMMQQRSPFLAGLTGAMQGVGTGLSMTSSVANLAGDNWSP